MTWTNSGLFGQMNCLERFMVCGADFVKEINLLAEKVQ
jgi:hypothetical protein